MASSMKKYVLTAVTLGLIAAGSALLIAGTNALTKEQIAANERKAINNGLSEIYDGKTLDSTVMKLDKSFTYVSYYFDVKDENNEQLGYAFVTNGSNSYGKISLIVGFNKDYVYKSLSVVKNEQSFASTLNKKYLNPLIDGTRELDDVSCGATYGAKLVRDMVNDASSAAEYIKGANNG